MGGGTLSLTLEDLLKRFPPSRIIVSSNGSTDDTCAIAKRYKVKLLDIKEPVGKIEAINRALALVKTEFCITMDDDVFIGDAAFPVEVLNDKNISGVAFRVFPKRTNWVTEIQSYEYRKSMDISKKFHNPSASVLNISGAIGLFKTEELVRQINLHTGEFSGEDLQRTLLILLKDENNRVILSESVVETDAPDTVWSLYKQRVIGWGPGLLANTGKLFKLLFKKGISFRLRYEVFHTLILVLMMDMLRLIALPILVWYPKITIIIYLFYVCLELIPYLKLKKPEPVWVIFVAPLYGVFNFLARVSGMLVFFYRRVVVRLAKRVKLDDYRGVDLRFRFLGLAFSFSLFIFMTLMVLVLVKPMVTNELFRFLLASSFLF